MSLLIYAKSPTDNTCIPDVNSGLLGQFDFGTDWTEARFGVFLSNVSATDDNAAGPDVAISIVSSLDRIFFGLKDSSNLTLPGQAGSLFLGLMTHATGLSTKGSTYYGGDGNARLYGGGFVGTTLVGATNTTYVNGPRFPSDPSVTSAYCGYYGIKITITDRGLATQSVTVASSYQSPVSGADYSAAALRALLLSFPNADVRGTIAWNNGSAAYDIPDSLFIRLPFTNNRIRISCVAGIKTAPV